MSKYRPIILVHLALAVIGALLVVSAADAHASTQQVRTSCFSAASWSANDADRPCTTVMAPEDDRVRVIQGTDIAERSECVIRLDYINDAHCHRTPPLRAAAPGSVKPYPEPVHALAACASATLCAQAGDTQEDGSVNVEVFALVQVPFPHWTRVVRCILGNPQEERHAYRMPCAR